MEQKASMDSSAKDKLPGAAFSVGASNKSANLQAAPVSNPKSDSLVHLKNVYRHPQGVTFRYPTTWKLNDTQALSQGVVVLVPDDVNTVAAPATEIILVHGADGTFILSENSESAHNFTYKDRGGNEVARVGAASQNASPASSGRWSAADGKLTLRFANGEVAEYAYQIRPNSAGYPILYLQANGESKASEWARVQ